MIVTQLILSVLAILIFLLFLAVMRSNNLREDSNRLTQMIINLEKGKLSNELKEINNTVKNITCKFNDYERRKSEEAKEGQKA